LNSPAPVAGLKVKDRLALERRAVREHRAIGQRVGRLLLVGEDRGERREEVERLNDQRARVRDAVELGAGDQGGRRVECARQRDRGDRRGGMELFGVSRIPSFFLTGG
jgi:hypothetical protein